MTISYGFNEYDKSQLSVLIGERWKVVVLVWEMRDDRVGGVEVFDLEPDPV